MILEQLPVELVQYLLQEWIGSVEEIVHFDMALANRDRRREFLAVCKRMLTSKVGVRISFGRYEKCIEWLTSRHIPLHLLSLYGPTFERTSYFNPLSLCDSNKNIFSSLQSLQLTDVPMLVIPLSSQIEYPSHLKHLQIRGVHYVSESGQSMCMGSLQRAIITWGKTFPDLESFISTKTSYTDVETAMILLMWPKLQHVEMKTRSKYAANHWTAKALSFPTFHTLHLYADEDEHEDVDSSYFRFALLQAAVNVVDVHVDVGAVNELWSGWLLRDSTVASLQHLSYTFLPCLPETDQLLFHTNLQQYRERVMQEGKAVHIKEIPYSRPLKEEDDV